MKVKFKEALELNSFLGGAVTKGLAVSSILSLIDLKDELQAISEKYRKVLRDIMDEYEVSEKDGSYNWSENPKKEEITAKIEDLVSTEMNVVNCNKMSDEDIIKLTEGQSLNNISFVRTFLKKQKVTPAA